ncbi:MAG: AMP-binding protein [Novosphingobium sp.]|nr:AMP-binding protein [Novosphingobium sp.]
MFFDRARTRGDRPFLTAKIDGQWRSQSWREVADKVCLLAEGLRRIGLNPGDRVILVSENRPEWCIADLAIMAAGMVTVPTYVTNTERDHLHILQNSGAKAVIVSSAKLAKPLLPAVFRADAAEHVIAIEPLRQAQAGTVAFHEWAGLLEGDAAALRTRIMRQVEKQGRVAEYLMDRAIGIGEAKLAGRKRLRDGPMNLILEKTLRPKIRQRFGGRIKAMVSGGAPLNPDVGVFFETMGITLLQGYGQTEAGPVISCNRPAAGIKMDTVGPPLDGVEVRIAADGEILVRGELVMQGYWRNSAETARSLQDGWLHTGDIGHLDGQGRIVITDRKKDMIVNDKGDNVSPQKVEGMLTLQPEIMQAMVAGDRRPYLVGLVVPDAEWAAEWAVANGEKFDMPELQGLPAFRNAVRAAVDRVNRELSVIEKVRQIAFADEPFSIENEEMTPSMKIRRHKIRERYGARLDGLYKA